MMTVKKSGGSENGLPDLFALRFDPPTDALLARTIPNVSVFMYYRLYVINGQINDSV